MTTSPKRAPNLYFEPCIVCGAEHGERCFDAHGLRMAPHRARVDEKARADLLAWKNLGARKTG